MRVLLTRPLEDGTETARQLRLRGHEALIAPLMSLRFLGGGELDLKGVQAILATSANGVRALAQRTRTRDLPIFAVGPQSAAEARKLGFAEIKSADGDADALAKSAREWAEPSKGALLHVAGVGNDGKLAATLSEFAVRREILYAVIPAEKMPAEIPIWLARGRVDAALFFSSRSGAIFRELGIAEGLDLTGVFAVAISPAVAAALKPLTFASVRIAPRPNLENIINLLT